MDVNEAARHERLDPMLLKKVLLFAFQGVYHVYVHLVLNNSLVRHAGYSLLDVRR